MHGRAAGHVGIVPWVQVTEDSSGDRRYHRAALALPGQLSIWRMTRRRHRLPVVRGCARVAYHGTRRGGVVSGGAKRAGSVG